MSVLGRKKEENTRHLSCFPAKTVGTGT